MPRPYPAPLGETTIESMRAERYASFDRGPGARFEKGDLSLEDLAAIGDEGGEPALTSGKQELYENLINQHIR